jgi:2,4-dienoyl-CoA reductase-like NADH-dependent reductase (Old Yellow Enzyme family)
VTAQGRITPACLGLWDDATEAALKDKLSRARTLAPALPVFIQLSHAGRKASSATPWEGGQLLAEEQGGWAICGPSEIPQLPNERTPHSMSTPELQAMIDAFVTAALRADRIGIDGVELHCAHGYLLHQFLSPIANQRSDAYGGSFENRIRFPLELFAAVRKVYQGVLGIRISASDWIEGGWTPEETADFAARLKPLGCDFVHGLTGPGFRLCTSARFLTKHEERNPTSSRTSKVQAGCGKRTACHCWRQPRRGTSSTCLVLDLSHNKKREKSLLRLVHPETKLAVANEQRAIDGDSTNMGPVPLDPNSQRLR